MLSEPKRAKFFSFQFSQTGTVYLLCFLLAVLTAGAYWEIQKAAFVQYDDASYVAANFHVYMGLSWDNIRWAFTSFHSANWHPLTWLSLMLDAQIYGLRPAGYHWTNVLLHTANALLLFFAFSRMTKTLWQSFFVAALFALHPLHVESVAWVSERKDVLSAFFMFLAMGAYAQWVTEGKSKTAWIFILFLFALGLMAKSMIVTFPFILLLLDYWPLERKDSFTRLLKEKIPLFILSAVSCVMTFLAQKEWGSIGTFESFPVTTRIANGIVSYQKYILKMFWPARLAVLYPYEQISFMQLAGAVVMILAVSMGVILLCRKRPYLFVGWLWYLVTLIPVIGLIQAGLQPMADRYTYIPSIGLLIILGWGVPDLVSHWRYRKVFLATCAVALLFILPLTTRAQARHWQNSSALFNHAIDVTENNYTMHYNLGMYLATQKKFPEATEEYIKALQIRPQIEMCQRFNNFGTNLAHRGGLEDARAVYFAIVSVKPDFAPAQFNMGRVSEHLGKREEAIKYYEETLRLAPDHQEARQYLQEIKKGGAA